MEMFLVTKLGGVLVSIVFVVETTVLVLGDFGPVGDWPSFGNMSALFANPQSSTKYVGGKPAVLGKKEMSVAADAPLLASDGKLLANRLSDGKKGNGAAETSYLSSRTQSGVFLASAKAVRCTPFTGVDNPHQTTKEGIKYVSGHGWWRKGTCSKKKAKVTVCLAQWFRYDDGRTAWKTIGCNTESVGRAKKSSRKPSVNKRLACSNLKSTGWANWVDVDVVGELDTNEVGTKIQNVDCRVNR